MTEQKLTKAQLLLLSDLMGGPLWLLQRGDHRPMNTLIRLGLADHRGGEWKITKAGLAFIRALANTETPNA